MQAASTIEAAVMCELQLLLVTACKLIAEIITEMQESLSSLPADVK